MTNNELVDDIVPDVYLKYSKIESDLNKAPILYNTLLSFKDTLENTEEFGGLKPHDYPYLKVGLEAFDKFIGIESKVYTPSLEDLEYVSSRSRATNVSLESIQKRIYLFWKWLVDKLTSLGVYLKQMYDKYTSIIPQLELRINALDRKLNTVSFTKNTKFFKNTALTNNLSIGSRVSDNLVSDVRDFKQLTKVVLENIPQEVGDLTNAFKRYANDSNVSISTISNITEFAIPGFNRVVSKHNPNHIEQCSNISLGNKQVVFYTVSKNTPIDQYASSVKFIKGKVNYVYPKNQMRDDIPILPIIELKEILSLSKEVLSDIKKYKDTIPQINREREELIRFATTQANTTQKGKVNNKKSDRENILEGLSILIPRLMLSPSNTYSDYAGSTIKSLLIYVKRCINEST